MAAAHLAARDYGACVAACGEVLAADPNCVTALLRRARAHMLRGDFQVGCRVKAVYSSWEALRLLVWVR